MNLRLRSLVLAIGFCSLIGATRGNAQIYVTTGNGVAAYNLDGTPLNTSLISGMYSVDDLTISGTNIYVAYTATSSSTRNQIGVYTITGTTENAALLTGLVGPVYVTVSGSLIYTSTYEIGTYTLTGSTVNAAFITGLSLPNATVISGSNLYVANAGSGTIGEYNASTGTAINASLITGLDTPTSMAVSGNLLFVATNSGTIGTYNLDGTPVNPTLISDISGALAISILGQDMYVLNRSTGTIGQYGLDGTPINPTLVTGLGPNASTYLMVVPEPDSVFLLLAGLGVLLGKIARDRCKASKL